MVSISKQFDNGEDFTGWFEDCTSDSIPYHDQVQWTIALLNYPMGGMWEGLHTVDETVPNRDDYILEPLWL